METKKKPIVKPENLEVVILCGGRGLRLSPSTDDMPKPLVYIGEKPMLKHILDFFHQYQFDRFYLCIGYRGFMIRDYFSGKALPYRIIFDDAGTDATMLQRVLSVRRQINGDRFILAFGDALADIDLQALVKFHVKKDSLLTITTMRLRSPFGVLKINPGGRVSDFQEKPLLEDWLNIGFMVVEKSLLTAVQPTWSMVNLYQSVAKQGRLFAFCHRGTHLTINTRQEKSATEEKIKEFHAMVNNMLGEKDD